LPFYWEPFSREGLHKQEKLLAEQIEHAYELERQLTTDVDTIKNKRQELNARKETLRARENRSQATKLVQGNENPVSSADRVLKRWESRVVADEYRSEQTSVARTSVSVDPLQQQFEQQEEQKNLRDALDQLIQDTPNNQ